MKPLKLIISAFGSYADEQTLDFTKLGSNGLYLVTGETGSGKTTIFDAISFALFGKASGDGRGDYMILRSDFGDEKAKTYVELHFSCGDYPYYIKRSIKKTGQDIVLTLPDGTSINGARSVNSKIIDIIGLDRSQFAQIVMIAQNDFLRFLQSSTDDRLKILRRIFGTESLRHFQDQLKIRVGRENDKRKLYLHDFERYEVDIYKRDETFAEWNAQIKTDKAELSEIDKHLAKYDKQKQSLAAELAVAEELCKKFAELETCKIDLEKHHAKAEDISNVKTHASRGEIALHKVKPLADEAQKARKDHTDAQTNLADAKKRETLASAELAEAVTFSESLPPLAETQDAFSSLSKNWEETNEKLKRLKTLQRNRDEISTKDNALAKTQAELTATYKQLDALPSIPDCQSELDNITNDFKNNEDTLAKLMALQDDFTTITDKQTILMEEQINYQILNADFHKADETYKVSEDAFLRSQAGIIASNLTDGKPCPVCGSTDHPMPAALSDDGITEEKLKKAREIKDKAQSERETKSSTCNTLKAEMETLTKRFLSDFSPFVPDITIETAETLLPERIGTVKSTVAAISEKKNTITTSLSELNIKSENALKKRDELIPIVTSLQSEIDTLKKRFLNDFSEFIPSINRKIPETELANLLSYMQNTATELTIRKEKEKKALDKLISDHDSAATGKTKAESDLTSAKTSVTERTANVQKLLKHCNEATSVYTKALQDNGFVDESAYTASLVTENELSKMKQQLQDYEKHGERLIRDMARLEKETAGKEQPDIKKLQTEAECVNSESKTLSEKRDKINRDLSKIETALKELRDVAAKFEKVEKTYAALKQLADTANGKQLDFETYVQMTYFENVLRAANLRLKRMSQDRYTLLRKTDSNDKRKRSGLEIEVLDAYTGKARSANSLSGGESFMASLSLALGLSDIVQQSAGGLHLNAMFIDEGFGSLDAEVLELAIRTLSEMAGEDRIIGIISHVSGLRERIDIDKQVLVEKTTAGSKISLAM